MLAVVGEDTDRYSEETQAHQKTLHEIAQTVVVLLESQPAHSPQIETVLLWARLQGAGQQKLHRLGLAGQRHPDGLRIEILAGFCLFLAFRPKSGNLFAAEIDRQPES